MANRISLDDLIKQNRVGHQALTPFFKSLGVDEYRQQGGVGESGDTPMWLQTPTDEARQRANGYSFDWQDTGPANTGTLTAFDPSGNQIGGYQQQDKTAGQTLGNWAKVAALAVPGLGAMGIGPMAGLLGGAGVGVGEAAVGGELGTTGLNAMRAGELAGYATNGAMPSSAAVAGGSGLLDGALNAAGSAAGWMKDNPLLGKLLMSGGMGLLSSSGGGSGGSAAPTYGPAKQWSSPIQQGIQSNPQQMNPAAIQRPAGLLAQGQQNDGAWRFLGGK